MLLFVWPLLHNKAPEQPDAVKVAEPPIQITFLDAVIVGEEEETVTETGAEETLLQPSTLQIAV